MFVYYRNCQYSSCARSIDANIEALGLDMGYTYEVSGLKTYATPATKKLPMNP